MNSALVASPWLYAFLESYEKFRPCAYPATAAERAKGIWTCGYGHTKGVKEGDTCTMAQALEWLHQDIANAVIAVRRTLVALTQNQFDALVSLVFNCGPDPLTHTLGHLLNASDYAGAAAQFKRWDKQGQKELQGLLDRRTAEAAHFMAAA